MARHSKLSDKLVVVRTMPVKTLKVSQGTSVPFQKSKRYKDLTELAENMHTFAKTQSNGYVRASAVAMFANHLLIIAHRQYRQNKK